MLVGPRSAAQLATVKQSEGVRAEGHRLFSMSFNLPNALTRCHSECGLRYQVQRRCLRCSYQRQAPHLPDWAVQQR